MIKDEILRSFAGKCALVTGGTGLIGRQVVDLLCQAGAKVRIVSLDHLQVHANAEHVIGDLTNFELCKQVTNDMDFVCHLAGVKGSVGTSASSKVASHFVPTVMFNTNVLEAARLNKVQKLVYTSSIGAYSSSANALVESSEAAGNFTSPPMDFAGWAKRMAELQIHAYKVQYGMENFAIVRPSNVYGPGDNFDPQSAMVIPSLLYRIYQRENPVVIWGDGTAVRDFVFSRDVAEGCLLALHYGTKGQFVNLGSGNGVTIRELVESLHEFIDFTYQFDPTKPAGFRERVMDITLASKLTGYNPTTSLRDGLKTTWDWFLKNREEYLNRQDYFKEVAG
jgi:GDP-L-fucose synthase